MNSNFKSNLIITTVDTATFESGAVSSKYGDKICKLFSPSEAIQRRMATANCKLSTANCKLLIAAAHSTITLFINRCSTYYFSFFIIFFCFLSFPASSQYFKISIVDNRNTLKITYDYTITQDSLKVKGISDLGETQVDYLVRVLKRKEKSRMLKFLNTYPLDSLKEFYFTDYVDYEYISADNFPRQITIDIVKNGKVAHSLITNSYVEVYARLFNQLNRMLADEVKIIYDKSKFKGFY